MWRRRHRPVLHPHAKRRAFGELDARALQRRPRGRLIIGDEPDRAGVAVRRRAQHEIGNLIGNGRTPDRARSL